MEVMVYLSVAVQVEEYPVPEVGYRDVVRKAMTVMEALITDDMAGVAIDRIELDKFRFTEIRRQRP